MTQQRLPKRAVSQKIKVLFHLNNIVRQFKQKLHSFIREIVVRCGKFGIGQIETVDLAEFEPREDELMTGMDKIREEEGYHSVILFITDILIVLTMTQHTR